MVEGQLKAVHLKRHRLPYPHVAAWPQCAVAGEPHFRVTTTVVDRPELRGTEVVFRHVLVHCASHVQPATRHRENTVRNDRGFLGRDNHRSVDPNRRSVHLYQSVLRRLRGRQRVGGGTMQSLSHHHTKRATWQPLERRNCTAGKHDDQWRHLVPTLTNSSLDKISVLYWNAWLIKELIEWSRYQGENNGMLWS